jgi:hypothetical protein
VGRRHGAGVALSPTRMRNICTDEAGTAANEAVSVVLALIVNPDRQWFPVVAALATLYQTYVPEQYRTGFAFHGRKLFGQNKYPGWDYDERKALMRCVMTLPSKFNIPIALDLNGTCTHLIMLGGRLNPS